MQKQSNLNRENDSMAERRSLGSFIELVVKHLSDKASVRFSFF